MIQSSFADVNQKRKITSDITNGNWYKPEKRKPTIVNRIDTSADEAEKAICKTDLRLDLRRGTAFREVMGRGNYSWDERKRRLYSVEVGFLKIESVPSHHPWIKPSAVRDIKLDILQYTFSSLIPFFIKYYCISTIVNSVKWSDIERSSILIINEYIVWAFDLISELLRKKQECFFCKNI